MMQNFIIADISNGTNRVLLYDERGQGKDADALCSLRIAHHLALRKKSLESGRVPPSKLLVILDNCVGQNKSRVVFMFFSLLSLLFYESVALVFLIPGHSHNQADRVVAWCRNKMRGQNLYTPKEVLDVIGSINSVQAEFQDHKDAKRPFFVGWGALMSKYFRPMPAGYTGNYFFEFANGEVEMRHLIDTPDDDARVFHMIAEGNQGAVKSALLKEIFGPGTNTIDDAKMNNIMLPRHGGKQLTSKKLKSLAKKYFSIPADKLSYYPAVSEEIMEAPSDSEGGDEDRNGDSQAATSARPATTRARKQVVAVGVRPPKMPARLGRPKKNKTLPNGQKSILSFFKKK